MLCCLLLYFCTLSLSSEILLPSSFLFFFFYSSFSCTTQPLTLTQQTCGAQRFQLPDFWPRPDPTSGPRLIKCKRHSLLGREYPNDPYNVPEDILPDLENDDMFSRRTCTFHSNTELARMKYGGLLTSYFRSEPSIRVVTQHSDAKSTYPDIEKDDVVNRRLQHQLTVRPLSGGPNNYHPVPIPEPWALPPKLQAKISAPCPPIQVADQLRVKQKGDAHQKKDDMLIRKLGIVHIQNPTEVSQRSIGTQTGPSVPLSCSEADLQKWQAIREASRLRYKKKLMVERLGFWVCRNDLSLHAFMVSWYPIPFKFIPFFFSLTWIV